MRIKTQILCSFALMLALMTAVVAVAVKGTVDVGRLAGDLNGRVVDKTRIAATIVDLAQQLRFIDTYLFKTDDAADPMSRDLVESRTVALRTRMSNYARLVDSPLEHSLLDNLDKALKTYLGLRQELLAAPAVTHAARAGDDEARLAKAFDEVARQSRGLSRVAEAQARDARETAAALTRAARTMVPLAAALASAVGGVILTLLLIRIFRPLARITESLVGLSQGRLDMSLQVAGYGGEIARMADALDVFRSSAAALAQAHEDTKAAHRRADALARHDALTGLLNRRVLADAIEDAVASAPRRGRSAAVLVLDLDKFKPVNDLYGHGAGDRVLCEVSGRIGGCLRNGDMACRLGGDEFAILIEHEPGSEVPHRVATRILTAIDAPIAAGATQVSVGASIGIAIWPADGADAEALLHAADLAMLRAKREGRGAVRFFEPDMDVQLRARADLEARIRDAVRDGEIRPHYQPLVDLRTDAVVGFEVLARWSDRGTVRPPSEFIQVADEIGLMPELTWAVLRQACRDARAWPATLSLALNVTPAQIADGRFPAALLGLLDEEGFAPARLELEVTENALIGDIAAAKLVMTALRRAGVRLSLDDFGTGYSSLHHLRDLKFDKLKIDRSFVQAMLTNPEATKIVETILALGRSLDIRIIAEGIEDREHLATLRAHGCEFGQGYHFGRPMGPAGTADFLAHRPAPGLVEAA